jgi:hypothetical protein
MRIAYMDSFQTQSNHAGELLQTDDRSWPRLCKNAGEFDANGPVHHYCRAVIEAKNLTPTSVWPK